MSNKKAAASPDPYAAAAGRNNTYFVPRDGIDREVITADICRYLGNDALVRPDQIQSQDGRTIHGYTITAYRNLTSEMIVSLKEDSRKWHDEKRRAQAGQPGGSAQMRYSDYSRQMPISPPQMYPTRGDPSYDQPQPPLDPVGATGPGYYPPNSQGGYPGQGYAQQGYAGHNGPYPPPPQRGGYSNGYDQPPAPYIDHGAYRPTAQQQGYGGGADTAMGGMYPPTTQAGGYSAPAPYGYGQQSHPSAAVPPGGMGGYEAPAVQARDVFYGRGGHPQAAPPSGYAPAAAMAQSGYDDVPPVAGAPVAGAACYAGYPQRMDQPTQYEDPVPLPSSAISPTSNIRQTTTGTQAQISSSSGPNPVGAPAARKDRERERDPHHADRNRDRGDRERERERGDRGDRDRHRDPYGAPRR